MLEQTNSAWSPAVVTPVGIVPSAPKAAPARLVKVLHIVNGQHFAGAERVQMHLGRCLPDFGFRADFACLVPGKFHEQFDLPNSSSMSFPMKGRMDLAAVDRIVESVRSQEFACVHAHTPRSAMIAAGVAKRLRLPWIYHLHSPVARDSSHRFNNWINGLVEKWSLRNVSHLIAVSNSLKQQSMNDGWRDDEVTVVHNGVPASKLPRGQEPVVGQAWTVGMVALIRPRKGLEVALRAIAIVRAAGLPIVLRCIGPFETDEYEKSIMELVARLGVKDSVEFTGYTQDVPAELAKLDAMVLPSLYGEGMPMVVLEAMAAGLPVVATRVEGTPEAIEHGKQGLLAQPNDPESLAQQLIDLLSGKYSWKQLSNAAIDRHATSFSDAAMAEKTAAVYRKIISNDSYRSGSC